MSNYLDRLKSCHFASDLFKEFRKEFLITEKEFWNTIYFRDGEIAYTLKDIPKSIGGKRTLLIPSKRLKHIQKIFSIILYNCLSDIRQLNHNYLICNHAFERKKTIITNAKLHRNKKYVLNIDLSDFFGSIHYGRICGFFQKDRYFELSKEVAKTIAQISCYRDGNGAFLPQGSPLSPIIASLIGNLLDVQLIKIAKFYKLTYSRYADDLTFSSNKEIPKDFIYWDKENKEGSKWAVGELLRKIIEKNKFLINDKKTRLFICQRRQTVIGIVVNKQLNVTNHYRKKNRAMLHSLFTRGEFLLGKEKGDISQLIGRLNHVASVKYLHHHAGMSDDEWYRAKRDFTFLCAKDYQNSEYDQTVSLLKQAIFYKYFVGIDKPVIIPEGKTDSIYFKTAYKALNEKTNYKYKFQEINTELAKIGLSGGTPQINKFLTEITYRKPTINLKKLIINSKNPVIFILDYDDGLFVKNGKANEKSIPLRFKMKENTQWTFIENSRNIYLLLLKPFNEKTLSNKEEHKCIENLLIHSHIDIEINNNHEEIKFGNAVYPKIVFAKYVAKNYKQFDFMKFKEIFSLIEDIKNDYKNRVVF